MLPHSSTNGEKGGPKANEDESTPSGSTKNAPVLAQSSNLQVLNFDHPTISARENLREDVHYITAFALAGFTNQFIAYMHLIFLGLQSRRIPIIPPFTPSAHVSNSAGTLRFGNVFNLSTAKIALNTPIVEWADVKTYSEDIPISVRPLETDPGLDKLGCWSVRQRDFPTPIWVPNAENVLKLDLSFTRVPRFAFFDERLASDVHTKFSSLTSLILPNHPHPDSRQQPLLAKSRFGSSLPPDEHLACFDFLYYVSTGVNRHEYENRWSPAWNNVGTHIRFTDGLKALAEEYVRKELGVEEKEPIPSMITVHIRRGDFRNHCKKGQPPPCYAPLDRYRVEVERLQSQLKKLRNISVDRVLVASNEKDPAFWNEVSSLGWNYLNHTAEATGERFGEWYPIVVDVAALSMGLGFVGTKSSTFSVLNAWRVEDWNGGLTSMIDLLKA